MIPSVTIHNGDCLDVLRSMQPESINCCVTSPPYWGLRDYGHPGQIGLEPTPEEYVAKMVAVFGEVKRVLKQDGTLWLNLGDSYARNGGEQGGGNRELVHMEGKQNRMCKIPKVKGSPNRILEGGGSVATSPTLPIDEPIETIAPQFAQLKPKDLCGIPWMVAFALRADGWYLRQDIIWHKPNPMPESVTDRCTKAHEYIFLLSKSGRYYFDSSAMQEEGIYPAGTMAAKGSVTRTKTPFINGRPPEYKEYNGMRNKRSVWTVTTSPYPEAHFATYPPDLIKPCILAGCPVGGTVLDPFGGSGTTGQVALELGRNAELIELNPTYCELIKSRTHVTPGMQLNN